MEKKKRKYKLKKSGLVLIISFVILIAALAGYLIIRERERNFTYKKHLSDTAYSIEGESVALKDVSYYIWKVEKQINEMAITYNPDNPNEFWNTYFRAQMDSTFTRDYAKDIARQISVYDDVMMREAQEYQITLTSSEKAKADEEAQDCLDSMTDYAVKETGITIEELKHAFENEAIIRKYIERASVDIAAQGYSGDVSDQLIYTGDYYKEKILTKYNVQYNEDLWGKITMGKVTLE